MALGEFDLIHELFTRDQAQTDILVGIGDDAAVLAMSSPVLIATDTLVCDVHFPHDTPAQFVGHKALAVNLSDIAAMGAQARFATLALSIPEVDEQWLRQFAQGWFALASKFDVRLIGGDTTRGPLSITVTVLGEIESGKNALGRAGARPGDLLYVSGTLGDARAGLELVLGRNESRAGASHDVLVERLHKPQPRVELGRALVDIASAAIDVSDGFCADLQHMLTRSAVGARIDTECLPVSTALEDYAGSHRARELALTGGDDFELLFSVSPQKLEGLLAIETAGIQLSRIGEITDSGSLVLESAGQNLDPGAYRGYEHFK